VRLGAAALGAALACVVTTRASAEESATIVLVERAPNPALAARLQAELEALGFRVSRRASQAPLESLARAENAVAAVGIDRALELWIVDTDTGKTAVRERISLDASDLAAVTASETVRARLLRVGVTPESSHRAAPEPPPRPEVAPKEPVSKPPPRDALASVWAAGGLHHAPGGLGPLLDTSFGGGFKLTRALGMELGVGLTPEGARVAEPEGNSQVRFYRAELSLLAHFRVGAGAFTMGPGCGILATEMKGEAEAPLRDRTAWVYAATPALFSGFRLPLAGAFGLRAHASIGLSIPRVVVRFDRREVADWGRPFALVALGPEFTFQ
jgi:hypothetical protein